MENKDILEENFKKNEEAWNNRPENNNEGKLSKLFKGKNVKIIAGTLVAVAVVASIVSSCTKNNKKEVVTTISDTTEEQEAEVSYKYVLYKPVDYSKETEIDSLISEINKHVEGEPLTKDFLNLLTKDITKEQFGNMTDEEIAAKLDGIQAILYKILSSNIDEFVREKENITLKDQGKNGVKTDKLVISGFDFINKDSYAHKTYQKKIDDLLERQLSAIRNQNTVEFQANANKYHDIVREVLNDKKLDSRDKAIILVTLKVQNPLYAGDLKDIDPDKYEFINADYTNPAFVAWIQKVIEKLALVIDVYLDSPNYVRKDGESYNYSDAKSDSAKAYQNYVTGKVETVTRKNVKETSELVSEATTGNSEDKTTVYTPPAKPDGNLPSGKPGGEPVGKPSVSESPTEKITEEDIKPETEPETWTYKDSEGNEWVVAPDDNGDYVFDADKRDKLNGSAKTLK